MPWIRDTEKWTTKQVEALDGESLVNMIFGFNPKKQPIVDAYRELSLVDLGLYSGQAIAGLGKPNINMQGYENTMGAWIFNHDSLDVTLVIFSDGHRKNCYKGTCYEIASEQKLTDDELLLVINDLKQFIPKSNVGRSQSLIK